MVHHVGDDSRLGRPHAVFAGTSPIVYQLHCATAVLGLCAAHAVLYFCHVVLCCAVEMSFVFLGSYFCCTYLARMSIMQGCPRRCVV